MSFFKKLFNKNQNQTRQLSQVSELIAKDIIVFSDSFALPHNLREQQFQVANINTHEFEKKSLTEWQLNGATNEPIYLTLEQGQQTYLKLSMKLSDEDVEQLFSLDDFAEIFTEPGNALLNRIADTKASEGWSCEQYQQYIYAQVGYFHRQDHRLNSTIEDEGEAFELYSLRGFDDQYSIDIQVWEDGETDVFLNLYRPTSDIKDFYPGS
ncbi:hypothetical protein [Thalassomonas sp. M1454]|uniref:hypothetical protein n=1 Tax=Thalassomonas sp. M1454 TaxID=2594477 RepID=UPI00117F820C|nr:hypothetical protein [Thalassomonas sp. M1454]TRX53892.1 hypothetical protein FNN08_13125 [Thalassomonas sp. M1454]